MGDLNIDAADKTKDTNVTTYLIYFSLTNIINVKTFFKAQKGTSTDVLLTNRSRSFHKTCIFKTGVSDHQKLILSVFLSCFTHIPPKTITYRNYKNFNETDFFHDLHQELYKMRCTKVITKCIQPLLTKVFGLAVLTDLLKALLKALY